MIDIGIDVGIQLGDAPLNDMNKTNYKKIVKLTNRLKEFNPSLWKDIKGIAEYNILNAGVGT